MIEKAMQMYSPDLVILDGGADLLPKGANDEQDSTTAINDLMRWTKVYDCHIVNVVHNSHGNEKARGHYGSTALRKCETAYVLTADGDITHVKHVKTRKKRPDDFCFFINPDTVLPELTSAPQKASKESSLKSLFESILPLPNTSSHKDLVEKVMSIGGVQIAMAKRKISDALNAGVLEKNSAGYYSIKQKIQNDEIPF